MEGFYYILHALQAIIETGGPVIYVIMSVALLLWLLIIERYWFMLRQHAKNLTHCLTIWQTREAPGNWCSQKIKQEIISTLAIELNNHISTIKTLIAICPLLGLLGTVLGMIDIFDVLTITGTGNARAMADGVSQATVPTMAGMVVALSGIYFSADLSRRAKAASIRLKEAFHAEIGTE